MSDERWLPVPGYDGRYEVSDQGRVKGLLGRKGASFVRIITEFIDPTGYPYVTLRMPPGRISSRLRVHRLVMRAFNGPRPQGLEIRHLDGEKTNNRLANLAYGTPLENAADTRKLGAHGSTRRTHCPQDHLYDLANTYITPKGARDCRACRNAASVRSKARRRAT